MPFAQLDDTRLYYHTDGDRARPCVVLSNSLGTDLGMWDAQAAALETDFFVLRYDTRGHGQSSRGSAPASIDRLGQDVVALLDHLGIERAHFCGISMGGLTGQWLGLHAPQRIGKLVLANTAARIGSAQGWHERAALVRREGMASVANGAAARWFTRGFIARNGELVAWMTSVLREQDAEGYAACCDALADADLRPQVARIANQTLVVAGSDDPVTTVDDAQWLAGQVEGASLVVLPASHISNVEAAAQFSAALRGFLG
jgi:3-oxoadipate enol-lactonase